MPLFKEMIEYVGRQNSLVRTLIITKVKGIKKSDFRNHHELVLLGTLLKSESCTYIQQNANDTCGFLGHDMLKKNITWDYSIKHLH